MVSEFATTVLSELRSAITVTSISLSVFSFSLSFLQDRVSMETNKIIKAYFILIQIDDFKISIGTSTVSRCNGNFSQCTFYFYLDVKDFISPGIFAFEFNLDMLVAQVCNLQFSNLNRKSGFAFTG